MSWAEKLVGRTADGDPVWQVLDSISLPPLRKGQSVIRNDCEYRGKQDPSIIAIGTWVERKVGGYMKNITLAVRLNKNALKLERLPLRNVKCFVDEDRD